MQQASFGGVGMLGFSSMERTTPAASSAALGLYWRSAAPPALDGQAVVAAVRGVQQAQHRQQPRQHSEREATHPRLLALQRKRIELPYAKLEKSRLCEGSHNTCF